MGYMSKYAMIAAQFEGDLAAQLRVWRNARVSAPAIARLLEQATGIDVTDQAVRNWLRSIDGTAA